MAPLRTFLCDSFIHNSTPVYPGALPLALVLERSNYSVTYGTQFWFWTADVPDDADGEKMNQVIESLAKNWSGYITAVLKKTQKGCGRFSLSGIPAPA